MKHVEVISIAMAVASLALCSSAWASCDKDAARDFLSSARQYAGWAIVNDHMAVNWNFKSKVLPKEQRLDWISKFSEADFCLSGEAKKIQFYYAGRLVGLYSPTTGVWRLE
jgi:hypothetical protein